MLDEEFKKQRATVVRDLAAKCRLALLSNTDPIHVAHFEASYSFVRHFPVRVYSCRVGSSKPSPAIYHHALREVRRSCRRQRKAGRMSFHFSRLLQWRGLHVQRPLRDRTCA